MRAVGGRRILAYPPARSTDVCARLHSTIGRLTGLMVKRPCRQLPAKHGQLSNSRFSVQVIPTALMADRHPKASGDGGDMVDDGQR